MTSCTGCYALGNACGRCPRCRVELCDLMTRPGAYLSTLIMTLASCGLPEGARAVAEVWAMTPQEVRRAVGRVR